MEEKVVAPDAPCLADPPALSAGRLLDLSRKFVDLALRQIAVG